jgi:putative membrane protein
MNDHDQKNLEQFKNYKGQNFDQDYVNAQVEDHTQDIALFTRASKEAKDPAIKKFATQTLPTLKSHLEAAKKLQK